MLDDLFATISPKKEDPLDFMNTILAPKKEETKV
jgi:hypothetical protein